MPDWVSLSFKVFDFLKTISSGGKKSSKETVTSKNQVNNFGGTVNQNIFIAYGTLPTKKQKEDFQTLIQGKPYAIESLDVTKKKALIIGPTDKADAELFDFILQSIPMKDHALWKAGLLLRQHFKRAENDIVMQIKLDMINEDPVRGKNIANLCNAGYLESEIIPMHKALTDLERSEDFIKFYDALVTQTPTSVFVGVNHNESSLKTELMSKIEYARNYSAPYVKVHALGIHHVELAMRILKEIRVVDGVEDVFYTPSASHLDATIALKMKK